MERNSTNQGFEQFLRQNAEDFKMHPSDKVWESISKDLHKPKRRYFGLLFLLVSSSLIGYSVYEFGFSNSAKQKQPTTATEAKSSIPSLSNSSSTLLKTEPNTTSDLHTGTNSNRSTETERANGNFSTTAVTINTPNVTTSINANENTREPWMADLFTANKANLADQALLLNQKPGLIPAKENSQEIAKTDLLNNQNNATKPNHKAQKKNSRFGLMFFFTPTVSYRKLTENKSYLRSSPIGAPYSYAALYDINNAVTHKPDIGLEFGATTKYALTKNVKLRAGVQFNINRYDIKAFKYVPEVATIALNNGYRVDSVSTVSNYRNFNGGKTDWLQNFYFQVSTPVGVEVKVHGNEKMHFGVASTIQPTYVLGDRAYLITADYKNYAQVPWLIRRWNVNTNLETFVAYSSGKLNWQVGPQVRYQLLSSFVSKYPVKENLFDFGLKVGISLNQNH